MVECISPAMQRINEVIERVAPTDLSVLITGESGVGKEVVARQIYQKSLRREQPFVKVNSAAIPSNLLESELFGYQKGAFTGADTPRKGRVEEAHRGTLFFDEIAELASDSQVKLLQMIQDKEFTPLGTNVSSKVDVRILVATNRQLEMEVEAGRFRGDLFYRLNVVRLEIPPLRERKDDLELLVHHFLEKYCQEYKKRDLLQLDGNHLESIRQYGWPGNVRELQNFVKQMVLLGNLQSTFAGLADKIRCEGGNSEGKPSLSEAVRHAEEQVERKVIGKVLERNGWNRKRTAEMLQISYRSLLGKIKKLGLR